MKTDKENRRQRALPLAGPSDYFLLWKCKTGRIGLISETHVPRSREMCFSAFECITTMFIRNRATVGVTRVISGLVPVRKVGRLCPIPPRPGRNMNEKRTTGQRTHQFHSCPYQANGLSFFLYIYHTNTNSYTACLSSTARAMNRSLTELHVRGVRRQR